MPKKNDVRIKGKNYRVRVETKTGADGVPEDHLDFDSHSHPRKEKRSATKKFWWNPKTKKVERIK